MWQRLPRTPAGGVAAAAAAVVAPEAAAAVVAEAPGQPNRLLPAAPAPLAKGLLADEEVERRRAGAALTEAGQEVVPCAEDAIDGGGCARLIQQPLQHAAEGGGDAEGRHQAEKEVPVDGVAGVGEQTVT